MHKAAGTCPPPLAPPYATSMASGTLRVVVFELYGVVGTVGDLQKLVEQDVPKGDNGGRLDLVPREAAVLRVEASLVLFLPPVRRQFVLVVLEESPPSSRAPKEKIASPSDSVCFV